MNGDMISKAANLCNIGSGWPSPWFRSSGRFCSLVYEPLSYLHKQSALYWSAEFGLVDVTKFLLDIGDATLGMYFRRQRMEVMK